jgi:hypothetical protein
MRLRVGGGKDEGGIEMGQERVKKSIIIRCKVGAKCV